MSRVALNSGIVAIIKRRTYSTTATVTRTAADSKAPAASSPNASSTSKPSPSSSWVPDPVTGYYRPGNRRAEIDAAEMRKRVFSQYKAQE